jgi:hypothetical protein
MMEPELAAKFPGIKTFAGIGIDDPYAVLRMDYNTITGFHAQILSVHGDVYIDPYARGAESFCISYYAKYHQSAVPFNCLTKNDTTLANRPDGVQAGICRGAELYTFRLAVACTGEYAAAVSVPNPPSVAAAMAAIVTTVNRVNAIYEKELAVRFILVANNNQVVYTNPAADPYTNGNATVMMEENQATLNSVIGFSNYDIGHVFGTGNMSEVATGAFSCSANKAKAVSGLPNPTGDLFDVQGVTHNIGHQFNARHTYNSNNTNCTKGPSIGGEEPGAGTTIMASANSCGPDQLQPQADPFFHAISFTHISTFLETSFTSCRNIIPNGGNRPPRIVSMPVTGFNIPLSTPFQLSAVATDDDGDPVTYSWETVNRGPVGAWNSGNTNGSPFFKSRVPKTTGFRTFPDMDVILAGYPANPPAVQNGLKGETLPAISANIDLILTIRDNRGGVITDQANCHNALFPIGVFTVPNTGPFKVNVPDGGEVWTSGSQQTILWDVAGSDVSPINNQFVNILLSTDGGYTYPNTLAFAVPNDGFEVVTLPTITTGTARIKVEAFQNIFFDISNNNFSIAPAPVGFELDNPNMQSVACPPPASVSYNLGTISNGGYNTPVTFSASGVPAGVSVSFSVNPVVPGNATTITLNNTGSLSTGMYYISITGVSGSVTRTRILVLRVQAGAAPVITAHPANVAECEGGQAVFSVTAAGAIAYQWQAAQGPGFPFVNITPGGNSPTLTLSNISGLLHNYRYRCVVTGQCNSVVSGEALLTVLAGPSVTLQPVSTALCSGRTATFTINIGAVSYTPLFQWQVNQNDGSGFTNIAGAVSTSITINAVTTAMNGYQYRCLVRNPDCTSSTISDAAVLTVHPLPSVTLSASPFTQLMPGLQTTLTATATAAPGASPLSYRWFRDAGLLSGVSGSNYQVDFSRMGNYHAEVVDARGCVGRSNTIIISDSASSKLFIYPNPVRRQAEITYYNPGGQMGNWQITISDAAGKVVYRVAELISGAYPRFNVNVITWSRGIYTVMLTDTQSGYILGRGKLLVQ